MEQIITCACTDRVRSLLDFVTEEEGDRGSAMPPPLASNIQRSNCGSASVRKHAFYCGKYVYQIVGTLLSWAITLILLLQSISQHEMQDRDFSTRSKRRLAFSLDA